MGAGSVTVLGHGWPLKQAEHTGGGPRTTFSIIPPFTSTLLVT